MQQSEDYLRRADEADADAHVANDPMICKQFRQVAEQWRNLAQQTDELALGRGLAA